MLLLVAARRAPSMLLFPRALAAVGRRQHEAHRMLIGARKCSSSTTSSASASSSASSDAKPSAPSDAKVSTSSESSGKSSLHSSDIAFKPTDDGWGYTKSYASGWDRIFAGQAPASNAPEAPLTKEAAPTRSTGGTESAAKIIAKQQAALAAAHECGALSDELLARAKAELEARI